MRSTANNLFIFLVLFGLSAVNARAQVDAVIPWTDTPPIIDGRGGEFDPVWESVEGHGAEEFNTVVGAPPEDGADLLPTWKALYDDENLYVLIEVVDVNIFNSTNCNWDDDSIEIYIDAQDIDSEDFRFDMNQPDGVPAYQFTAVAGDIAGGPYCGGPPSEENDETAFTLGINSYDGPDTNTRYPKGADISNGAQDGDVFYSFEVAFPWEALEESTDEIRARGSFGFGVAINDDDTDGSRETQLMWASDSPDLWMRSDVFPSVALGDPPVGGPPCDFDGNGACDGDDINQLMNEAETGGATTDLTGDGVVDDADRDAWLALAGPENGFGGPLLVGDTNLDGINDAADLNAVALSWHDAGIFNYTNGNVTVQGGPGVVVNDLNGLALNWQQTAAPLAAAGEAVPEPATPCWFILGLVCLFRRRRL